MCKKERERERESVCVCVCESALSACVFEKGRKGKEVCVYRSELGLTVFVIYTVPSTDRMFVTIHASTQV